MVFEHVFYFEITLDLQWNTHSPSELLHFRSAHSDDLIDTLFDFGDVDGLVIGMVGF